MGRLFWKFFFAFWLTVIVAGLGVGVVVWLHKPAQTGRDAQPDANGPPALIAHVAVVVFHAAGVNGLKALLRQWQDPFPLYVVDEHNNDLLGRHVAAPLIAEARRSAAAGGAHNRAQYITLRNGKRLLLFVPNGPMANKAGAGPPPPHDPPSLWLPIDAGLLASIVFSALLAWYMAKPVRYLRRAFEAAGDGNLDVRVQPLIGRRHDEIADLGCEYDRMAARLKELIGAQRRLFHDLSHELRSPLARLQAAVSLLRKQYGHHEPAVERAELETGRLDELVGELLLLARVESRMPNAKVGEVDLVDLIDDIVADARFEVEGNGCDVQFHGAGALVIVGRADLIGRALENVIRNAIKYTAPRSAVVIEAERDAEANVARLCVIDHGPGVAPTELVSIFEPFFRARNADSRQGYGLGLAIARRAIEAHGGTIRASNRAGGGLCVEINLPLMSA